MESRTDLPLDEQRNIALQLAVYRDDEIEVLKQLEGGAMVNYTNSNYFTSLHVAVAYGNHHLIKHLVRHGGNTEQQGVDGLRPIHMLTFSSKHIECLQELLKYNVNINGKDHEGTTALQHSVSSFDVDVSKTLDLLNFGFDFNSLDCYGNNCLHTIAMNPSIEESQKIELCRAFIEKGTNLNVLNICNETPLHIAVRAGMQHLVQLFLQKGADIHLSNRSGLTILEFSIKFNRDSVRKLLLEHIC